MDMLEKAVKRHLSLKHALFPLKKGESLPLHKEWTTKEYTDEQILGYARNGYNIGYRPEASELVIDVDPRNGGTESFKNLRRELGLSREALRETYPVVRTPRGGIHIYTAKDPEIKTRKSLKSYEGIDFISKGSFVAIEGCSRADGTYKAVNDVEDYRRETPAGLLAIIEKRKLERTADLDASYFIDPEELEAILNQIPAEDFDSHDDWFSLMCSSHHVTDGLGVEEFVSWSVSDPQYQGHEENIRKRWDSLSIDDEVQITAGTLYKTLFEYNGRMPGSTTALEDFAEELNGVEPEKDKQPAKPKISLIEYIDKLTNKTPSDKVNKALEKILKLDPIEQAQRIEQLREKTKVPKSVIKQQIATIKKKQEGDSDREVEEISQKIVTTLLKKKYNKGKHLIHADDQQFWAYNGKYWTVRKPNLIESDIYEIAKGIKTDCPDLDFGAAGIMPQCERVLRAVCASEKAFFSADKEPEAIINTANGELWLNSDNGKIKFKDHSYKSYLVHCIDKVEFDPKSECPLCDQTLLDIFGNEEDPQAMIRHLWELFGYCIQPRKNIASWWLLFGGGSNGKSLVIEILKTLIGSLGFLETSISMLDPRRDKHAFAALPGKLVVFDDDVSSKTILPDGIIKKISENKDLHARPLHGAPFPFRVTSTPIMASNHFPITTDLSHGNIRRANVIPFNRLFKDHEQDRDRARKIIRDELPGVLCQCLRGLRRLRSRGSFDPPAACLAAKRLWKNTGNSLFAFIDEMVVRDKKSKVSIHDLNSTYQLWCDDTGIDMKFRQQKKNLVSSFCDMGFKKTRIDGGSTWALEGFKVVGVSND